MAIRIPTYEAPQVRQAPVQAAPLRVDTTDPNAPIANAVGQIAGAVSSVYQQAQADAAKIRVSGELNKLREKQQEYTQWINGLKGRQAFDPKEFGGQDGKDAKQTALGWFDQASADIKNNLRSDAEKADFDLAAQRFRMEMDGHIDSHLAAQTGVVAKDDWQNTLQTEARNIALNALTPDGRLNGEAIKTSTARLADAAGSFARFTGTDEGSAMLEARGLLHAQVTEALLKADKPEQAQAYFDMNKGDMDAKFIGAMQAKIQDRIEANQVSLAVDKAAASGKPFDQQVAMIREQFKDKPEARKAAMADLHTLYNVKKEAERVAVEDAKGEVLEMFRPTQGGKRMSVKDIQKTEAWGRVPKDDRQKILDYWERLSKPEGEGAPNLAQYAMYYRIASNQDELAGMSQLQVAALAPKLGTKLTLELMKDHAAATNNYTKVTDKLEAVKLDNTAFRTVAQGYLRIPAGSRLNEEQVQKLGLFKTAVTDEIRKRQLQKRDVLGADEQQAVAEELAREVVLSHGFKNTKSPMFLVDTSKMNAGERLAAEIDIDAYNYEAEQANRELVARGLKPRYELKQATPQAIMRQIEANRAKRESK